MAFSTIQGSGGAPDSFVGTSGVDTIAITNSAGNFFLGAQEAADIVNLFGSGNAPAVAAASLKGGQGTDTITDASGLLFTSAYINGNANADTLTFNRSVVVTSTIHGGQGADAINVGTLSSGLVNGNKDNDNLTVGSVTAATAYGGQGNDTINLTNNITDSVISGDNDNDTVNVNITAARTFSNSSIRGGDGNDTYNLDVDGANNKTFTSFDFRLGDGNNTLNGNTARVLIGAGVSASGGTGNDIISFAGAAGAGGNTTGVTINTNDGTDQVSDSAINDTITGGNGADAIFLASGGNDRVVQTTTSSLAASASTFAAGNVAAGDTLTFANGLDIITNFTAGAGAGADILQGLGAAAPTTGIGVAAANGFVSGTTYFISGAYNPGTRVFTAAADGGGASTLIVAGNSGALQNNQSFVLLNGVNSATLLAGNFAA